MLLKLFILVTKFVIVFYHFNFLIYSTLIAMTTVLLKILTKLLSDLVFSPKTINWLQEAAALDFGKQAFAKQTVPPPSWHWCLHPSLQNPPNRLSFPPSQLALMSPTPHFKIRLWNPVVCHYIFLFFIDSPTLLMPHLYYFIYVVDQAEGENVQLQTVRVRRGPGLRESWDPGMLFFRIPFSSIWIHISLDPDPHSNCGSRRLELT